MECAVYTGNALKSSVINISFIGYAQYAMYIYKEELLVKFQRIFVFNRPEMIMTVCVTLIKSHIKTTL
jgi:hypothetical protein